MTRFHSTAFGTILMFALNVPAQQTATAPGSADKGGQSQSTMQNHVPTAEEQLKALTIRLDLTEDQQTRIKPILKAMNDATLNIPQDQSLSREERLERLRPIRYKAHDQILKILNEEQKKKLDEYLQGPHPEMHGNQSGATSSPKPPRN